MKEDITKKIVQQSEIKTSDAFVEHLMHKIEAEKKPSTSSVWEKNYVLMVVCSLALMVSFGAYKMIFQFDFSLVKASFVSNIALFTTTLMVLLFLINHVIKLYAIYAKLSNR